MVIAVVKYLIKEGKREELVEEIRSKQMEQRFSAQPGNVCFRYGVPVNEENALYLTDVWETEEAFEAHRSCDVMPDWKEIKDQYMTGNEILQYDAQSVQ